MIAFATLFLGLVIGAVDVELVAAKGVARVELVLDGRSAATVGPPFVARLDLGAALAPHELEAIARDAKGNELGRARQAINRPRAMAEAGFVLEAGTGGTGRVARLTWRCVTRETPRSLKVSFDGRPLEVRDPTRIALPPHVPEQLHFLRAELDFGDEIRATADATFGGTRHAETLTNLTALPVLLDAGRKTPTPAELRDAFLHDGAPVAASAVEEGPAEVVFVLSGSAAFHLERLQGPVAHRAEARLAADRTFRLVWPRPMTSRQSVQEISLFPMTPDFAREDGGVLWAATSFAAPSAGGPPKTAKAVATAALSAAARDRRRALVLLLGDDVEDASDVSPAEARAFLERLRVPFVAWSVAKPPSPLAAAWRAADVSTRALFGKAMEALGAHLDRQRIVWVEGTWLPQSVTVAPAAAGISVARWGASGGDGRSRTDE